MTKKKTLKERVSTKAFKKEVAKARFALDLQTQVEDAFRELNPEPYRAIFFSKPFGQYTLNEFYNMLVMYKLNTNIILEKKRAKKTANRRG
jgi:hypothetical protein